MRDTWENIWRFRTKNFCVDYDVALEWDTDLSWDEDGSVRADLESGKLQSFQARVVVYLNGREIGEDYLGGCIYETPLAFIDHRGIKRHPGCGSYFSDMVSEAITAARKELCRPRPYIRCA